MRTETAQTVMHSYPGMVALVTVTCDHEDNVMAAGWHSYISYDPPIYGVAIGRERHTYSMIRKSGCFTINFLSYDHAKFIQQAGVYSGSAVDKFKKGNIEFDRGIITGAPILRDAYVAYECEIMDRQTYGDHDWFVGEIKQFYRDPDLFHENGLPKLNRLQIPLYLGRSTYVKLDENTKSSTHKIED
ncbi:flavin reductase family protein [Aquibacillus koreensis]|uniref:Flavin reductase family protein n=1 Tax=Aquibacillus koreensis TaxID=279446 RepID=A0A9X4AIG4_9BACI|nr:flavin reductase family protein [Aquibacillus koreensis]MCT2534241.1 flavin reductase family protein [Aquibacillus koreensis]MDC3420714.1 flavin reductase family protein [Aquibacillus koreensis]